MAGFRKGKANHGGLQNQLGFDFPSRKPIQYFVLTAILNDFAAFTDQ
jgi:hypothetical protein